MNKVINAVRLIGREREEFKKMRARRQQEIKRLLLEFIKTHRRLPKQGSLSEERALEIAARDFIRSDSRWFDPKFAALWKRTERARASRVKAQKQAIREFCKSKGHLPSIGSKSRAERVLGRQLYYYICPKSGSFDPDFAKEMRSQHRGVRHLRRQEKEATILAFCIAHQRRPSYRSQDPKERVIGRYLKNLSREKDSKWASPGWLKAVLKFPARKPSDHQEAA